MTMLNRWKRVVLAHDRAAVGVIFAIMLVPFILVIGSAIDTARLVNFKTALQDVTDAAALAGATSYYGSTGTAAEQADAVSTAVATANRYTTAATSYLPPNIAVTFPTATASFSAATGLTVTVTSQASLKSTFLAFFASAFGVTTISKANDPVVTVSTPNSGIGNSNAWDKNVIYYYLVPAASAGKQYVPPFSALNQLYTNASSSSSTTPPPFSTLASNQIGFALANTTGGLVNYAANGYAPFNGYDAPQGDTNWSFSTTYPPTEYTNSMQLNSAGTAWQTNSSGAYYRNNTTYYPTAENGITVAGGNDCSLQVELPSSSGSYANPTGSCYTKSTAPGQQYFTLSCASQGVAGKTLEYQWNDMGGSYASGKNTTYNKNNVGQGDDKDYNDAVYTFTCSGAGNSGVPASSVPTLIF